ncbi:MAG: hypothetical protein AAF646_02255 [Pseudomonadota bacterium]
MRLPFMTAVTAALFMLTATASHANWELRQAPGIAVIEQTVGPVNVTFQCLGAVKNRLNVSLNQQGGWSDYPRAVMIWMEQPDGRIARHSMDSYPEDGQLSAELQTSDLVLEQLRNASALEFTIAGTGRTIVRTNASGTGAFRNAVLEQCGF